MLRTVVARQRCGEVRARSALISVRLSGKTVLTHGPDVHTVRHTQSPCGVECEKKQARRHIKTTGSCIRLNSGYGWSTVLLSENAELGSEPLSSLPTLSLMAPSCQEGGEPQSQHRCVKHCPCSEKGRFRHPKASPPSSCARRPPGKHGCSRPCGQGWRPLPL